MSPATPAPLPYSYLEVWLIIVCLFLVVLATRNVFNVFGSRFKPEAKLAHALNFAPLAALVAIVVPEFARAVEQLGASPQAHLFDGRLLSGMVLVVVGVITKNSLYALLSGTAVYAGAVFLLPHLMR